MSEPDLNVINLGDGDTSLYVNQEDIVKLEHNNVTYYKDAAIKFLKDRNCTFEELIGDNL